MGVSGLHLQRLRFACLVNGPARLRAVARHPQTRWGPG